METRLVIPTNESRTQTMRGLVENLKTTAQRAGARAVERAKATDQVVRDHPYQTIGLAAGLAVLVGVLIGWKWNQKRTGDNVYR